MEKRKLSRIPRPVASDEIIELAGRITGIRHIVSAELVEDKKILLLNFFEVSSLTKGKTEAAYRIFLSSDDYITQDLGRSNVKWLTAALDRIDDIQLFESVWSSNTRELKHIPKIAMASEEDTQTAREFFKIYRRESDEFSPWTEIYRFQEEVKGRRLDERNNKILAPIDLKMEPIKEPEPEFEDWVWDKGMSFSRYGIYKHLPKGKTEFECTHCKKIGVIDTGTLRMRNNEKGECPFCGSKLTYKSKGKMPCQIVDERWFLYVDPQEDGFLLRYFHAWRHVRNDKSLMECCSKTRLEEYMAEYSRCFYTFSGNTPMKDSYEFGVYHQRGASRWIPDEGLIACMESILYPGNLPHAWEHTPMKYSALEELAKNMPTVALRYEDAMSIYLRFPKLEWICKMGLNQIAKDIVKYRSYGSMVGKIDYNGKTIYEILGLTKLNVKVLQEIDGNHYELRLLQAAQSIGLQWKPEQLREYYETFECNTELLNAAKRKVSIHKLVKYISKESENYPIGDKGGCYQYSYMRYTERTDPRIERKRNCAHDWIEYLKWCEELKYDLDNMFIYMPTNFKKVHDRTMKEYQALQDKKAAEEKKSREIEAARMMAETKKAMEEIFSKNDGVDAFSIKGKGLVLVVPKSGEEIRKEGEALHHCVGGYVERVAQGKTSIFFIRKASEPDKSYFTMEWRDNKIIQCRGLRNCGMPADVKAFVQVFEQKMLEALGKGKKAEESERKVS